MKTLAPIHDLEQAVPFLLARAGARMGGAFAKALKPLGLSLSEWRVCASLQFAPNQTLSELSSHAASDLSATSRIVDRLEEQGLVRRQPSATDGRSVRVALTPEGLEQTVRIIPLAKHYEAVALKGFTRAEIKLLRAMLLRLYGNAAELT